MNAYSAFFHSSILTSVMILCEVMVYYIVRYFSPHFFERGENFHFLALFAIFSKLMFFTVIFILLHFLKGRQNRDERQDKSAFFLALIPITSVFVMVTFTKISDSCDLSPILNWMLTLSAVFLLTINLLIFGIRISAWKEICLSRQFSPYLVRIAFSVSWSHSCETPFVVITVVNSSRKNPFDEQSGIQNTTKANKYKHGFGIKSIRKIVAKYHGNMQMYYNQESLTFHTIITVKQQHIMAFDGI